MLEEFWHYLGVRTASREAFLLGYAREMAALQARQRRCRQAWSAHIQATKHALLNAARGLDNSGGAALIIGGGSAHDLPITELLQYFEQIVLLDIAFSYPTRRLAKRWPGRVLCLPHDVTGVVGWLAQHPRIPLQELMMKPPVPELLVNPRWVASVNCLTQLPLLPLDWLANAGTESSQLEAFGRALILAHLNWLDSWQTPVCLITEIEDQRQGSNEQLDRTDYRPILADYLQQANQLASWNWLVNPPGELPGGVWESRTVAAYLK
ncbi:MULTISPECIES: hypothetical protein [Methylomonas]|uniref:Uncharacterized protein n=2 Tax=Methylomonas TaxID=416 RepID=A0A126T6T8_9GAMM|nr:MULTISPECIES: hypothetical protein [Methylomonas]AMK77791.1 hypothetical protein JT25_015120 [Methylomonas denitrificans]OAI08627.1 hypothetical protein A1342_15810 [Methylomonas methanica]TCV86964.1 hypothetical protein EDE11_103190 [Methylomonas methanica]